MATYLADRVIVFEGTPSVASIANAPQTLLAGMNRFLELLGITFRRDPNNFRPRINKANSVKVNRNYFLKVMLANKMNGVDSKNFSFLGCGSKTSRPVLLFGRLRISHGVYTCRYRE